MSWWVKEISTITEDQSERLCIIETDTPNDLPNPVRTKPDPDNPGQTITDYTIVRGSKAYCLSNSKHYKLNSQGQWVLQKSGQEIEISADDIVYDNTSSGMTATNVQDAIDEIHTLDDTQDRALAELYGEDANQQLEIDYAVNTGTKNLLNNQYFSMASGTGVTITDNGDGTYNLSGTPTGTATYLYTPSANFSSLYGLKIGGTYTITAGSNKVLIRVDYSTNGTSWDSTPLVSNVADQATFTIQPLTTGLYIRFRSVSSAGSLDGTVLKPMIRDAVIRNSTFEPYAPTNRELYEGENQLQARVDQITGIVNQIPSNADLNTYYDIGMYQILSTAIAQTLVNIPSDCKVAGSIEVKRLNGSARIQFYYPNWASSGTNPGSFYFRQRTGTTAWTNWYYFSGTQVATVQSVNSLSTLNLDRNDLNETLDTNFDLIDSIPEEEEGELE